jgi:diphosphomevalonate decarboxylase
MGKQVKVTAKAPANIAFIKYWGKQNEKLRIPENGSISMCLDKVFTITTVEFSPKLREDSFVLLDEETSEKEELRVYGHLDRIRNLAGIKDRARVISKNNFPRSTGLSSSASGLAALTLAASLAAGLNLKEKELSRLARVASGSACRSIPSGFVEWRKGKDDETSYAYSLYPASYWQVYDVIAVVSREKKEVSTTEGQALAKTSPFLSSRLGEMSAKIKAIKKFLKARDFFNFGLLSEQEALNMHAVMITSSPPLLYWTPETLRLMRLILKWRREGLEVYFTINTGQDCHILTLKNNLEKIRLKLKGLDFVKKVIINKPAAGARMINKHLF